MFRNQKARSTKNTLAGHGLQADLGDQLKEHLGPMCAKPVQGMMLLTKKLAGKKKRISHAHGLHDENRYPVLPHLHADHRLRLRARADEACCSGW
jgi:hypothetical protein